MARHPDRSDDAARQASQRAKRDYSKELLLRRARNGHVGEAAAMLGGHARDPEVRPLLAAAGLRLAEDGDGDTELVDRLAKVRDDGKRRSTCERNMTRCAGSGLPEGSVGRRGWGSGSCSGGCIGGLLLLLGCKHFRIIRPWLA